MRIAILDPFAGISGDMTLGALLAAGVDQAWLERLPGRLGFPNVTVRIRRVERAAVQATKVDFAIDDPGQHHGRHVGELVEIVRRAPLSDRVRDRAVRAFQLFGEAEGRIHGTAPERVHLHEVGAVDAVLDIVGAVEGFERLGVDRIYHLPVAVGNGWVTAEHGKLPVPAPATLELLSGVAVRRAGPVVGEATTPTGAVLLRVLSDGPPPDEWRTVLTAWGAGERDPADYPNALRLIVAEGAPEAGVVEVIATDMDDLAPEYVEPLRDAVFAAGAVECVVWPTQGKKGRMSLRLEALAAPAAADRVIQALFAHSTTAGVRRWTTTRATLARRELVVELASAQRVRVKVWDGPTGARLKPEYADVLAAARASRRSALDVAREAERLAEAIVGNGTEKPSSTKE